MSIKSLNRSGGWARNLKLTVAGRRPVSSAVRLSRRSLDVVLLQLLEKCSLDHITIPKGKLMARMPVEIIAIGDVSRLSL